mmetsp:Transcript_77102/g.184697  ORF Transcript_77102/g.184697 Transcript_77102/m.184697 type:complete len:132 (+) Transcript_77102:66-461(+)
MLRLLGVGLVALATAKHVGKQRVAVSADGMEDDAGVSLMRKEDAGRDEAGAEENLIDARADCTGLKMAASCDEHRTAGVCESHKVNSGSDAFRCSWKQSVPAGDKPAIAAECFVDTDSGSCGKTNSTGPER